MKTSTGKQLAARLIVAALALLAGSNADAFCFADAAARYKVSETLLRAIAQTESSNNPNAHSWDRDGSDGIGLMQINSSWLPTLAPYGIGRKQLADACTNVNIGAWVLAQNIQRYGDTWKAVGAYNATTPSKQAIYVDKVWRNTIAIMKKGKQ